MFPSCSPLDSMDRKSIGAGRGHCPAGASPMYKRPIMGAMGLKIIRCDEKNYSWFLNE
jgi:hypothetical protein